MASGNSLVQDASQSSGKEPGRDGKSSSNGATARARVEEDGDESGEGESHEYEFTGGETQLLRICMDTMHTAGLALIVQGIATGLLGAPSNECIHVQLSEGRCSAASVLMSCSACVLDVLQHLDELVMMKSM